MRLIYRLYEHSRAINTNRFFVMVYESFKGKSAILGRSKFAVVNVFYFKIKATMQDAIESRKIIRVLTKLTKDKNKILPFIPQEKEM